ncbi:hypothetical protein H7F37_11050 [Winogradskyella sp. PAMC22761]|nr:hypothetical protein H7F37_11050 [Winogradskyella sp. PAMC22761]
MIKKIIYSSLFVIIGFCETNHSQHIQIYGNVMDSLKTPLPYANILVIPKAEDEDIKFAITEKDGSYKLGLVKN